MATILDSKTANPYAPFMARFLQFLCVAIILCHPVFSQPENDVRISVFSRHYQELKQVGQPYAGSPEESAIIGILSRHAERYGFVTETTRVQEEHSFHSFARSLRVVIPGRDAMQVALIMPLDAPRGGAGEADPWLNPALGLWLMDRLGAAPVRHTVVLEFLGGDDGVREVGAGTRRLLLDPSARQRAYSIYLNWNRLRGIWRMPHGMSGKMSPAWLLTLAIGVIEKSGVRLELPMISSQLHRIGLGLPNQLGPYLATGLPTIALSPDAESPPFGIQQAASALLPALVSLFDTELPAGAQAASGSWDSNYLVLDLAGRHLVISEFSIVLFFMSGMVLLLLMVYFRRTRRHRYLQAFGRHWPSFLLVVALCILANLAAWAVVRLTIPSWSPLPEYRHSGLAVLALRLVFTVGALSAVTPVLGRRLAAQSSFYGSAAFLSCLLLVVAIAIYNVTLSVYALLAAVCISLSNLSKWRWVKLAAALSGSAALLIPFAEALVRAPGAAIDQILFKDPVAGSLLFGCVMLPLCFLACRLWLVFPVRRPWFQPFRRWAVALMLAGSLSGLAVTGFAIEKAVAKQPDIALSWEYGSHRDLGTLKITGDPVIQSGAIAFRGLSLSVESGRGSRQSFALPVKGAPVYTCQATALGFLDRKTITITIDGNAPLVSCSFRLAAMDLLTIHALDFPFRYIDAQTIELFIGNYPPMPLKIGLTVPKGGQISYSCDLTAVEPAVFMPTSGPSRELGCLSTTKLSGGLP
jgi:hypothetical protein